MFWNIIWGHPIPSGQQDLHGWPPQGNASPFTTAVAEAAVMLFLKAGSVASAAATHRRTSTAVAILCPVPELW